MARAPIINLTCIARVEIVIYLITNENTLSGDTVQSTMSHFSFLCVFVKFLVPLEFAVNLEPYLGTFAATRSKVDLGWPLSWGVQISRYKFLNVVPTPG